MVTTNARVVVADAGPLIHLDELGLFSLLNGFAPLLIPESAWAEACRHRPKLARCAWFQICAPTLPASSELGALASALSLGRGETDAIRLLQEFNGTLMLCDDAAARLAAESMGFRVRGTIGILLRSVRLGAQKKSRIIDVLRSIPAKSTLHISRQLLSAAIEALDESPTN